MGAKDREAGVKVHVVFGRGSGRGAGLYTVWETRANPEAAREAAIEAAKEARKRERAERKRAAEEEARAREREEMRQDHREENGAAAAGGAQPETEAPPPPPRPPPPPTRRRTREQREPQRARTFAEYDAAFEAFLERALREHTFVVAAIPLPPVGHAPVAPSATQEEWHVNVRRACLRWHPDKWARLELLLSSEEQKEALKQLTQAMFRAVTNHKKRGFRNARATA